MEHYFTPEPEAREQRGLIIARLRGRDYKFYVASGIFSWRSIDRGTALLVENMIVEEDWQALDLGCGYGVIGTVAADLAKRGFVYLVDINKRAVKYARLNLRVNDIRNAKVLWGDLYEPVKGLKFDTILCHPPFSAGYEVVSRVIRGAELHLKPGGLLQLVARHRKGGKRMGKEMEEVFGNLRFLAKEGGYRVYCSEFCPEDRGEANAELGELTGCQREPTNLIISKTMIMDEAKNRTIAQSVSVKA